MFDLFLNILAGVMIYYAGYKVGYYMRNKHTLAMLDSLANEPVPEEETDKVFAKIEKHGNIFYLFEEETDKFIAQGANWEEVRYNVSKTYKDKRELVVDTKHAKKVGLL